MHVVRLPWLHAMRRMRLPRTCRRRRRVAPMWAAPLSVHRERLMWSIAPGFITSTPSRGCLTSRVSGSDTWSHTQRTRNRIIMSTTRVPSHRPREVSARWLPDDASDELMYRRHHRVWTSPPSALASGEAWGRSGQCSGGANAPGRGRTLKPASSIPGLSRTLRGSVATRTPGNP
jgi:hypothetical protein